MSVATTWGTTADERRMAYPCDRYLETLGKDGWEMTGILPLMRPESSYFILKRPADRRAASSEG